MPRRLQAALLAIASALMSLGYFLLTVAMRTGAIGRVAPFRYSGLLLAVVIGYVVWGDVPNTVGWLEIAALAGTSLYATSSR